jgi:hypothetical protein
VTTTVKQELPQAELARKEPHTWQKRVGGQMRIHPQELKDLSFLMHANLLDAVHLYLKTPSGQGVR